MHDLSFAILLTASPASVCDDGAELERRAETAPLAEDDAPAKAEADDPTTLPNADAA
jgi:hypothetical protein